MSEEDNGRSRQMRHDRAVGALSEDAHVESLVGDVVATVIANRLKWMRIDRNGGPFKVEPKSTPSDGIRDAREAIALRDRIIQEIDTALVIRLGLLKG